MDPDDIVQMEVEIRQHIAAGEIELARHEWERSVAAGAPLPPWDQLVAEAAPPENGRAPRISAALAVTGGCSGLLLAGALAFYTFVAIGATGMSLQAGCGDADLSPTCVSWERARATGWLAIFLSLGMAGLSLLAMASGSRLRRAVPASGAQLLTMVAVGFTLALVGVLGILVGPAAPLSRGLFSNPSSEASGGTGMNLSAWLLTLVGLTCSVVPSLLLGTAVVLVRRRGSPPASRE